MCKVICIMHIAKEISRCLTKKTRLRILNKFLYLWIFQACFLHGDQDRSYVAISRCSHTQKKNHNHLSLLNFQHICLNTVHMLRSAAPLYIFFLAPPLILERCFLATIVVVTAGHALARKATESWEKYWMKLRTIWNHTNRVVLHKILLKGKRRSIYSMIFVTWYYYNLIYQTMKRFFESSTNRLLWIDELLRGTLVH